MNYLDICMYLETLETQTRFNVVSLSQHQANTYGMPLGYILAI